MADVYIDVVNNVKVLLALILGISDTLIYCLLISNLSLSYL